MTIIAARSPVLHKERRASSGGGGVAAGNDADYIAGFFARSLAALERAAQDSSLRQTINDIAAIIGKSFGQGGKLLILGNGGSAADAQHLAAEFVCRYTTDRAPLPAMALTTDSSALTAIGNDFGFEQVFERQIRALGHPHDVMLAISTSGRSPNVIAALRAARAIGMTTVGFTGQDAAGMKGLCDFCLSIRSAETAVIQQLHIVAGHIVCGLVERSVVAAERRDE
jgi:D-sedoheptulose 7-phosphate isomerase